MTLCPYGLVHTFSLSVVSYLQASCWTGAIVLFLILDLMSMCFAAADAADEKLSSTDTRRVFAIVFAVLYGEKWEGFSAMCSQHIQCSST